jgi:hypothetical protein
MRVSANKLQTQGLIMRKPEQVEVTGQFLIFLYVRVSNTMYRISHTTDVWSSEKPLPLLDNEFSSKEYQTATH